MKDNLQDLVEHTYGLGKLDLIKIVGTKTSTQMFALSEDKSVIFSGNFKTPIIEFDGTFGIPNLSKLKTILGFEDYDENAIITVSTQKTDEGVQPSAILFETKTSDFVNNYRFMKKSVVEDKIKSVSFKGATWNIEFEPTVAGILRLKKQHQANSEEETFTVKVENGDLKIYFGDPTTHSGNFIFYPQVTGTLARSMMWPIKTFLAIMDLPGDKTVRISDQGVAEIVIDSGLAIYYYRLPAQIK